MKWYAMLALVLALMLPIIGCGQRSVEHPELEQAALKQAAYPDYPKWTEKQIRDETREEAYWEAVQKLRGEGISPEQAAALVDFTARSLPLVLEERTGENTVYSPASLWSALAMLARCADGESRTQLLGALNADGVEDLQTRMEQLWRGLYVDNGRSALVLANALWFNDSMEGNYVPETLEDLAEHYFAGTYKVPVGEESANQTMADWVTTQTNGLITPQFQTKGEDLMTLISTLYYKAGWETPFEQKDTEPDLFTDAFGAEQEVPFLHQTEKGMVQTGEHYQAARLATELGHMVFVLPEEGTRPENLLQDPKFLSELDFRNGREAQVIWSVPKFDLNCELDLRSALAGMGITDVLNREEADLSAISTLGAWVEQVRQLTRIQVDEEKVEAAAATIIMAPTAMAAVEPEEVVVMDLDRPFLFLIQSQGVPIFVGIVNRI